MVKTWFWRSLSAPLARRALTMLTRFLSTAFISAEFPNWPWIKYDKRERDHRGWACRRIWAPKWSLSQELKHSIGQWSCPNRKRNSCQIYWYFTQQHFRISDKVWCISQTLSCRFLFAPLASRRSTTAALPPAEATMRAVLSFCTMFISNGTGSGWGEVAMIRIRWLITFRSRIIILQTSPMQLGC